MTRRFEFGWRTAGGLQIFAQGWQPVSSPQAAVCLIHGLGEHSSRYGHVAEAFNQAGYSLLTFDLPGHGRSGGKQGHSPAYNTLLDNIDQLLETTRQRYPARPIFLYGHSMGGNLALNHTLRRRPELAGVIVTAPWLSLAAPPSAVQLAMLKAANRLWPALTISSGLNTTWISRDSRVVHAYQTDPLIHDRISLGLFFSMHQAGRWALAQAHTFWLPLLLIHGRSDRLTSPEASRQFASRVPANCTFKLWDNLYHEVHNEPEQNQVLASITTWLQKRLAIAA